MPMHKLRAVSYSRVSTEEEKQRNALAKQIQENRDIIDKQGWVFAGEYIDEGKSGTQIKKRDGYLSLFEDLERDIFDIVVIKDQDRLMRNPRDWYLFTDRLLKNNKKLYIYLDQTFYNPENSLITGIKAILAEEYSRHLSRKINNAHKNRQENGSAVIVTNRTWGYKNTAGRITVDEEERPVIEQIFTMYANGMGSRRICRELSRRGIHNRKGNILSESQIRAIVRNPLYMGTAVMNRTHLNFDTKVKEKVPKEEWRYHVNAVPAIVSGELWQAANERIDAGANGKGRTAGRKTGTSLLSGKLECGECGQSFWRNKRSIKNVYWYCSEYYRNGIKEQRTGCDSLRLKEEELYGILGKLGNVYVSGKIKNDLLQGALNQIFLRLNSEGGLRQADCFKDKRKELLQKRERLLDLYLEGLLEKTAYEKRAEEIVSCLEEIERQEEDRKKAEENRKEEALRKKEIRDFLQENYMAHIGAAVITAHTAVIRVFSEKIEVYTDFKAASCPAVFMAEMQQGQRRFHMSGEENQSV